MDMAVEFKDYYHVLGVSRTASAQEIRTAFRRLARQCHPDVAGNSSAAETRFKEVNEAYEVLGDPAKRKRYDSLAADWRTGAGHGHPNWSPPGNGSAYTRTQQGAGFEFRFRETGFSDFFEQLFGAMNGRARTEPTANGDSGEHGERGKDVEAEIVVSLHETLRGSTRPITIQRTRTCTRCQGAGRTHQSKCPACGGSGQIRQIERYQVRIPAGVRQGQRLRLPGQGDPSATGNRPGDLYLRVRFENHPEFKIEGDDLLHELDLAPWEAVLGTEAAIPTLNGNLQIRIPAGSQNEQRFRLKGQGLPTREGNRGDLLVVLRIQVPVAVAENERALWQKLARTSEFKARP